MSSVNEIKKVTDRLSHWEKELNFHKPSEMTSDLRAYLDYYGFTADEINLHFGKVEIDRTKVMVQIFAPKRNKGTVFLLHGYLDHVGSLQNIIQYLNEHQYSVLSYDLQGHGLSEGETASVNAFDDYVLTLEKLLEKARDEMAHPFYVIGHSTGGAIAINYVLKHQNHRFDKIVLAAPLIRSNYWLLTKAGVYLARPFPFIDQISRTFKKNSSDKKYLSFTKNDPLQPDAIPMEWLKALIQWNRKIQTYPPTNADTCMIQGNKDKTVEWKYNQELIKAKFNDLHVYHIENGRHQLFNEEKQIREKVFNHIRQFLED